MSYAPARSTTLLKSTLLSLPLLLAACSNSGSTPPQAELAAEVSASAPRSLDSLASSSAVLVDAVLVSGGSMSGSYAGLWGNGATAKLTVPAGVNGSYKLQLQAKGDVFQGEPVVEVRRGNTVLAKVTLGTSAQLYDAGTFTVQPGDVLNLVFVNDYATGAWPKDRNALIDYGLFTPTSTPAATPTVSVQRVEAEAALNSRTQAGTDINASGGKVALLLFNGAGLSWTVPASMSSGTYNLSAQTRQQAYQGNAELTVKVNGTALRSVPVTSTGLQALGLGSLNLKPGDVLETVFTNDAYAGTSSTDRNAYVDFFTLSPAESTAPTVLTPIPTPVVTPTPIAPGTYTLSNSNATADAKKLYAWMGNLKTRTSNRVLSGQSIVHNGWGAASGYTMFFDGTFKTTGKYPAMLEAGYIENWDEVNKLVKQHWDAGGLSVLNLHWNNPFTTESAWKADGRAAKDDLSALLTTAPASAAKTEFYRDVDNTLAKLKILRDQGVVVLFRPFHEANGYHFWWGVDATEREESVTQYKALWRDFYNYVTVTNGLNNLIWVYAPLPNYDGEQWWSDWSIDVMAQYPGDDVVDVLGVDIYEDKFEMPYQADYAKMSVKKPFYFSEVGPSTLINKNWDATVITKNLTSMYSDAMGFMVWHSWADASKPGGWWSNALVDTLPGTAKQVFDHPWVITREEVNWR